jgi:hypothetical protein
MVTVLDVIQQPTSAHIVIARCRHSTPMSHAVPSNESDHNA